MIKKILCVVLTAFCFVGVGHCFPVLMGRVVDDAHILTNQQKDDLDRVLTQASPHQVVAVSLSSLDGKEIEEYGYQLGRHWGIGRRDENDGVLVLIAPNERQLRIEVGYGLEHVLTDAQSSRIVNNVMVPLARQGKYDEALVQGATAVVQVLIGDAPNLTENVSSDSKVMSDAWGFICVGSLLFWFVLMLGLGIAHWKLKDYKKNSRQNRFLFFYENVLYNSALWNMYIVIMLGAFGSFILYLIVFIIMFWSVNIGNVRRWRKNPKFPYKESEVYGGRGGRAGSSFFGGGRSSGGGFHGGGGSFGGGGASGRF